MYLPPTEPLTPVKNSIYLNPAQLQNSILATTTKQQPTTTTMTTPVFYANARDDLNASAVNKERLALNHFNFFLKTYCVQIGINIVEAAAIP
jgi:hypothetical protein